MSDNLLGIILVCLASICGGMFALPSKYAGRVSWESLWGSWYFLITAVIPITLAFLLVRDVWDVWLQAGSAMILPAVFGVLWGAGSVLAAICYARIGLSISYAIIPGVQVIVGPLVPLLFQHPEQLATARGRIALLGLLFCTLGVIAGGYAGLRKERDQNAAQDDSASPANTLSMKKAIPICLAAGLLCACFNYAYSFGDTILDIAKTQYGNTQATAAFAVWVPGLLGGGLVAMAYCGLLMIKNGTWRDFAPPLRPRLVRLAVIMAATNWGVMIFYGWGAQLLGVLGPSAGFAILFSGMLLVGNVLGFVTGEWKNTSTKSRLWIAACMVLLVLGICVLGAGNSLAAN